MEKDESQTDIINRILSRLPPRETEKNITALKKLVKDEEDINPVSFEFIELEDSFKKKFLATPYTLHDERDDCYRSPYTGFYEPGEIFYDNPLKDMPQYKPVEKSANGLLPHYFKMYFPNGGKGNFYALGAQEETLRGIFVIQANDSQSKKLEKGTWRSLGAVEISIDKDKNVKTKVNYNMKLSMDCESKYFGNLTYDIIISEKWKKKYEEKLNYPDKEWFKLYVKYSGKAIEEVESKLLNDNIMVYHQRAKNTVSQCRMLSENNAYFSQKKKIITKLFI